MIKKVFNALTWVLLICVAVLAVLLIGSTTRFKSNFSIKLVLSGSMEPTIKTGSVIFTMPASDYKVGDIITFSRAGNKIPITHRIVDISQDNGTPMYQTKGDANQTADEGKISRINIIGKVRYWVPYIGYGLNAVKNPIGFAVIIVVPATILIYSEIMKIKEEVAKLAADRKKKKEEKEESQKTKQDTAE